MMIQTDAGNDEGVLCSKCGVSYPKVAVVDVADPERKPLVMLSKVSRFVEAEHAGSKIDYRCVKCRNCGDCSVPN